MDDSESYMKMQIVKPDYRLHREIRDAEDPRQDGRQRDLHDNADRKNRTTVSIERDVEDWNRMDDSESYMKMQVVKLDTVSFKSSETQRILDRMDDSETYMEMQIVKPDSLSPSRAAHEQEPKENIGRRPYRQICLLCLVMSALIIIVAGLSIHVSQIRQSKETCHRIYHELNSTLQSKLSALNSNLSDLKQMHSELHHQFTAIGTKTDVFQGLGHK
ncbi:uncharacterized protein [Hemitrygon akajei]|uniref:uncharacterized protein n=1 Tax=Hemitrygon akajei TaxID=2704970 RepID=UPI003BF9824A